MTLDDVIPNPQGEESPGCSQECSGVMDKRSYHEKQPRFQARLLLYHDILERHASGGDEPFMVVRPKTYFVYILSNRFGVLYTGVTSDLSQRLEQHKRGIGGRFTKKYNVTRLVYWEVTTDVRVAIMREKEIKSWRREKKLDLIRSINPEFQDLSEGVLE